jgi:hypothetical protein
MASKKASKKSTTDTKAKLARKKIVTVFVNEYERIESSETKLREELSPVFRKVSVEMYESVKVNKVFKSGRALAKEMGKHHSVVQRYVNAGEWLTLKTDAELKKQGMCAYDAKTQLRKMKSAFVKSGASVSAVKNAKAKKQNCSHTVDNMVNYLENFAKENDNIAKLKSVKESLIKIINTINEREESKKQKAFVKSTKVKAKVNA